LFNIASVHNGSALFTGDAGQGESEIRRYLFEHDLLEAIIALPNDMFYNTGITTYIFLITNRKSDVRMGKVMLINSSSSKYYHQMRKNLGKKRVELSPEHVQKIVDLYLNFEEGPDVKIFDNDYFGYRQITIHQPIVDENGSLLADRSGKPKSDVSLKDTENIPLKENVEEYFKREVKPYASEAWYNPTETKIGYEVSFNKYFYKYMPPRALADIAEDLEKLEAESEHLLEEIIE
jgi:type I restriction enzyme M protein